MSGFSCKLVNVPTAIAELLGFIHGLHLCWAKGFRNIVLPSDCIEAINFVLKGYPFFDILL